jgi:ubiquinone/menaquinone biosynthesis C-methylase UbiE
MWLEREPSKLDFGATPELIPTLLHETGVGDRVLEVGCGTGLLAIALRDMGRRVTAVDVSQVALDRAAERAGDLHDLALSRVDGVRLPFQSGTFDFVYSVEVVEHLHERDGRAHFAEVARVLRPGARYWFMTPSRHASLSSAERFGLEVQAACDVHLKEWTHGELRAALKSAGFRRVRVPLGNVGRRARLSMPSRVASALESVPGLPTARFGYVVGLNQCIVRATR